MKIEKIKILRSDSSSYNIPLFLESNVDEMGIMVGFDGMIDNVEFLAEIVDSNTVRLHTTFVPEKFYKVIQQNYTINWGDGNISGITINNNIVTGFTHTYLNDGVYDITFKLETEWDNFKTTKRITVPLDELASIENDIGSFTTLEIPSYVHMTGQTQNYNNDLDFTNTTGYTTFTYLGIGGSKLHELKKYGKDEYNNTTNGSDENGSYIGYSFTYTNDDNTMVLTYRDYENGTTLITGSTSGFTKEEIFNTMITRNEHFLGFVDEPQIYSDVFVERGKQGVMEKNFRLGEIDNIGELEIYGNGYFNIRKQ